MKSRNNKRIVLFICAVIYLLMLSCTSEKYYYHSFFHVQGFLDANNNGLWDEGESEISGFTFETTATATKQAFGANYEHTITVSVPIGGVDFTFDAYFSDLSGFKVEYSYKVSHIPEGYVVGKIDTKLSSTKDYEEYDLNGEKENHTDEVYEVLVPFIGDPLPTPTPTPTATATPTSTPLPTATFTPTPSITAELLGYGSYGYAVNFVKIKINNKPAGGTFFAVVDGKDYPCIFMTPTSDTLICQGEPFPSGKYVDVVLYYEGSQIFSCQIFRAIEEKPTKTPAM